MTPLEEETVVDPVSISEDETLLSMEKETIFSWAKDQDRVHVHTDMGSVARRLVQHPEFELIDTTESDGVVTGLRGTLPLGCLSVSMKPRKSGSHAEVITSGVLREDRQ